MHPTPVLANSRRTLRTVVCFRQRCVLAVVQHIRGEIQKREHILYMLSFAQTRGQSMNSVDEGR